MDTQNPPYCSVFRPDFIPGLDRACAPCVGGFTVRMAPTRTRTSHVWCHDPVQAVDETRRRNTSFTEGPLL